MPGCAASELRDAADVIGVMVRRPDRRELDALARERRLDRRGLAGIDDGGDARRRSRGRRSCP